MVSPVEATDVVQHQPPPQHITHSNVVHTSNPPPLHTAVPSPHSLATFVSDDTKDVFKSIQRPLSVLPFYSEMGTFGTLAQRHAIIGAGFYSNFVVSYYDLACSGL